MAKKFIRTNKSIFDAIPDKSLYQDSIVFIEDTKEIWTNGNYYGRNDNEDSNILYDLETGLDLNGDEVKTVDKLIIDSNGKVYSNNSLVVNDISINGQLLDKSATGLVDLNIQLPEQEAQPLSVSLTYLELKQLRDSSSLIPGTQYRITDYISTTTQEGTVQEWCPFDVIVIANSTNTLNENAFAIQHEGDIYFSNSNLSAWKLKYCLDNDESRFLWADTINGRGVIYALVDEFNNEAPFDFKSIKINSHITSMNHYIFASNLEIEADDYSLTGNVINNKINPCFKENGQQLINGVFMLHEYNDCQIKNNYIGYNVNNVHIIEKQGTTISNNNIGNNNSYIHMQGTNINNYHIAANTNNTGIYELLDIDNNSHLKFNVAKKSNNNIVVYNEADLIAG